MCFLSIRRHPCRLAPFYSCHAALHTPVSRSGTLLYCHAPPTYTHACNTLYRSAGQQVPIEDLERTFMFNTGFQSCSAFAKNMEAAIGALTLYPDFAEDLRNELDGKAGILSRVVCYCLILLYLDVRTRYIFCICHPMCRMMRDFCMLSHDSA